MEPEIQAGLAFLGRAQNADGGWGYEPGGASIVEPTAAAHLACALHGAAAAGPASSWLRSAQMADGGWGISPTVSRGSWMTAWAVWSLALGSGTAAEAERGARWLLDVPVLRLTDRGSAEAMRRMLDLDARLTGWPWQPGEASWVIPSALAIVALGAAGLASHPRLTEGVAFLIDRACASGGWNFGNPVMLGKALPPLRPETGIVLLALRSAGTSGGESVVSRALNYLASQEEGDPGHLGTAWSAVGASVWGARTVWEKRVRDQLAADAAAPGPVSVLSAAIGLLALVDPPRLCRS